MRLQSIKFITLIVVTVSPFSQARADLFLATHVLLNTMAAKFLPDYESTSYHGPYITGTYGFRYELGDAYKTGSDTEGSEKSSPGFGLGYQFLRSSSHKLALTYDRKSVYYQTLDEVEGENVIDSFGMRFNWGMFAFKLGWSSHRFEDDSDGDEFDGGAYTGIGFDIYMGRFSVYMDITSHYLETRKKHIAGGDFGFRLSFGDTN